MLRITIELVPHGNEILPPSVAEVVRSIFAEEIDKHLQQFPLATMAEILDRLDHEFTVSGAFSSVRLDRLKVLQHKLNLLVAKIGG